MDYYGIKKEMKYEDGVKRGGKDVTICNGTNRKVDVVLTMSTTRSQTAPVQFKHEFNRETMSADIQVYRPETKIEYNERKIETTLWPHKNGKISLPKMKSLFTPNGTESLSSPIIPANIMVNGVEAATVCLAPGHGIIVHERGQKGEVIVEQARSNKWYRRNQPWVARSQRDFDPHRNLPEDKECSMCDYGKKPQGW